MNQNSSQPLDAARQMIQGFGRHYDYDVSYLEELLDASPVAFQAFQGAMPMARCQKAAPTELLMIAKIAAMRAQDCGPCTLLSIKMAREQKVSEAIIRGALHAGAGLSDEQRDVHDYARAVALNDELPPDLLPRLKARWGMEVIAELAVNILATKLYPTIKRALGRDESCNLIPELAA